MVKNCFPKLLENFLVTLRLVFFPFFLGGAEHKIGWAFGIGLERLAMKLFNIPDIRLFWSEDPRFLSQFTENKISEFKPFSKYPPTYKDLAFWVPEDFSPNSLFDVVRGVAGDIVEKVSLCLSITCGL